MWGQVLFPYLKKKKIGKQTLKDNVSLCYPGWSQIHGLRDPPTSTYQQLGLQAKATMPGYLHHFSLTSLITKVMHIHEKLFQSREVYEVMRKRILFLRSQCAHARTHTELTAWSIFFQPYFLCLCYIHKNVIMVHAIFHLLLLLMSPNKLSSISFSYHIQI